MEKEILKEPRYAEEIIEIIRSGRKAKELIKQLDDYHDMDIAQAYEQMTAKERRRTYKALGPEWMAEVFSYLENIVSYLEQMDAKAAAMIIESMESDDAVDALDELEEENPEFYANVVPLIDDESRKDIRLIRSYDEEEIGSKMTTNFVLIGNHLTIKEAMRELVAQAEENDNIYTIYFSDDDGKYYGAMDIKDLITAREFMNLQELISTSYPYVRDHELVDDCLERLRDYEEDSIPVLNSKNEVIGVITSQDIIEVVDDEMGEDYARLAGLTAEEDLNETLPESMKKRIPWLVVLLFLGVGVSTVVGMFEGVVAHIALLVSFQSLILDMAGNVGTQSLAVTIRVLMDEDLKASQKLYLVFKEMRVGMANGLLLGLLAFLMIGGYVVLIKGRTIAFAFAMSGCVGAALLTAMIISSFIGTVIPMFFHKVGVDPAVASGPLITTVNDLVAVLSYYGLAFVLLIKVMGL